MLDAFQPRGATWSGQVISSSPDPSGGPFMTHLLHGGGVPRVHRAPSPVSPWLPDFATPRSVHHLAAVAVGAYPPHQPANAWSPGVPAPPGPCYVLCLPRFPLPAPRFLRCVWPAVPSGCPLSSLAGTPFHAFCAFRGLGPVALSGFPRVSFVCLCARALAASAPPPLPGLVWRAHLKRSRCWGLVGPFDAVRAPPRVLPRSLAPFGLLWGWGGPVPATALCVLLRAGFARCVSGTRVPGGGISCLDVGFSGVRRSPSPHHSSVRVCSRGPLPTCCWCGGCGRGDASPTPQRALLEASFARCGGGRRAPGGTVPWVWAIPTAHTQVKAGPETRPNPPPQTAAVPHLRVPRHPQGPQPRGS